MIYRKIDPELMKSMRAMGNETVNVILHAHENCQCRDYLDRSGISVKYELPFINAYSIEIPYNKLQDLAAQQHVKYIAQDITVKTQMNIASQEIGSRAVNETGYSGEGIGIAFIDTGIYPHSDFIYPQNRIVAFKDFVKRTVSPYDDNGHGTFVAGVAAGNGYSARGRYQGVAPKADIIAVKAMDSEGGGNSSDILAAMQWVADNQKKYNIRVLSMSLGSEVRRMGGSDAMVQGVDALWNRGIVVTVAAGNSGPDPRTITTPGISSKAITVGAADDKRTPEISDDVIANFSSRGPAGRIVKPDIVAPGVDITSLSSDVSYTAGAWVRPMMSPYTTMSGTSVATPIVAGAAALILGKNTDWTPDQVKTALRNSATQIVKDENAEGTGIINLRKALEL